MHRMGETDPPVLFLGSRECLELYSPRAIEPIIQFRKLKDTCSEFVHLVLLSPGAVALRKSILAVGSRDLGG